METSFQNFLEILFILVTPGFCKTMFFWFTLPKGQPTTSNSHQTKVAKIWCLIIFWKKAMKESCLSFGCDFGGRDEERLLFKVLEVPMLTWQVPVSHMPLTAEIGLFIKEVFAKRSVLAERANSYSTGQFKNIYLASKSDSSAAWGKLREVHRMADALEVDTHAHVCLCATFLDAVVEYDVEALSKIKVDWKAPFWPHDPTIF